MPETSRKYGKCPDVVGAELSHSATQPLRQSTAAVVNELCK
jgi:hypothetical protein